MAEFVEVLVEATGKTQMVPADWLGHEVLGKGLTEVKGEAPAPAEPVVAQPPSDVQLTGPVDDLPIFPAAREAVLAARSAAEEQPVPTEHNTHDEIDAFAEQAGIDLGDAKTKAEKVAVIHQLTDGTESSDENPVAGDKE